MLRACQGRYSPRVTEPRSLPLVALVLALALGVIVVHARVVAGGKTWDDVRYHTEIAPPRLAAADQIQHRTIPAWWDGSGLGVPLAAEPQHGALYPLAWLAATPRALDLVLLLHLAWAALGVAIWARRLRASDYSALVVGLLAAATGVLASTAVRGALLGLAHLPWLGAAVSGADDKRPARTAISIALLLGLVGLAGEFAVLVDALALVLVLGVGRIRARWLAPAVGAGLAIAAAQWLPAALHLAAGDRAGATVNGLPLGRLLELIVPGAFGGTLAGSSVWAPSLFVGAPLLALAAVVIPTRRVLGLVAGLVLAALVCGRGGWPAWLGAPELHVAALALVLAPHAGSGLDALLAGKRRAVLALGAGAGCTVLALGALGALRSRHPEAASAIDRALLDGGLSVACTAGAIALARTGATKRQPLVLALLVVSAVGAAPSIMPVAPRSLVTEAPAWAQLAPARRPARVYSPPVMPDVPDTLEDAFGYLRGATPSRWDLAAARSEDPARLAEHDAVWLAAAQEGGALLDRFGIGLAILPSNVVLTNKMTELGVRGRWSLASLPVAPPASVLRGSVYAVATRDATSHMFAAGGGTNVLRGTVVLKGTGTSSADRGPPLPCEIQTWTDGDIDLACTTDAAGFAVVSSTPAPGWSVTVDGAAADWLVADVLRRATPVAPGLHHVHWTYTTPGLRTGAILALAALLGLLALYLATRKPPPADDVN